MLEKYGDECAKRGLKCELHASHDTHDERVG